MDNMELDFIRCIIKTKKELELASRNFDIAEAELIDYYAYQIKANKAKLSYLIKEAKKNGYTVDMVNELKAKAIEQEAI